MNRTEAATYSYRITYGSKAPLVCGGVVDRMKIQSLYQNTFSVTYGMPPFTLRNSRIKKGSGKGRIRLQKVTVKSVKSVDNLTWCV